MPVVVEVEPLLRLVRLLMVVVLEQQGTTTARLEP